MSACTFLSSMRTKHKTEDYSTVVGVDSGSGNSKTDTSRFIPSTCRNTPYTRDDSKRIHQNLVCVQRQHPPSLYCCIVFILVLTVSSVFLAVVLTLKLTVFQQNSKNEGDFNAVDFRDLVCLSCNNIGSTIGSNDTTFQVYTISARKFCCTRDTFLQKLVLLVVSEKQRDDGQRNTADDDDKLVPNEFLRSWQKQEVAAHVFLNTSALPGSLMWEEKDRYGIAFNNNMQTVNGRIRVPSHGFYFIYSSVSIEGGSNFKPVIHSISRQNQGLSADGMQTLLVDMVSVDIRARQRNSFLCGVINLRRGDEVWANVSDVRVIGKHFFSNYLGVYRILNNDK